MALLHPHTHPLVTAEAAYSRIEGLAFARAAGMPVASATLRAEVVTYLDQASAGQPDKVLRRQPVTLTVDLGPALAAAYEALKQSPGYAGAADVLET